MLTLKIIMCLSGVMTIVCGLATIIIVQMVINGRHLPKWCPSESWSIFFCVMGFLVSVLAWSILFSATRDRAPQD